MKRSRTASLGLEHLPFFEAVGEAEENSPKAYSATAGLLMLRLIDHWILAGPVMVEPESVSVKSVRARATFSHLACWLNIESMM